MSVEADWLVLLILAAMSAERAGVIIGSIGNTRWMKKRGGVEYGANHFPLMIGVNLMWMALLWINAPNETVHLGWLVAYLAVEVLRFWSIFALGKYYSARVIIVPDMPLVRTGPYRILRHPIYAAMFLEFLILPMVFGLWWIGAVMFVPKAIVLAIRIRCEDKALATVASK